MAACLEEEATALSSSMEQVVSELLKLTSPSSRVAVSVGQHIVPKHLFQANGIVLGDDQVFGVNLAIDAFARGSPAFLLADGVGVGKTMVMLEAGDGGVSQERGSKDDMTQAACPTSAKGIPCRSVFPYLFIFPLATNRPVY